MFKKVLQELEKLKEQQKIHVPINMDKEGYVDRECPSQECLFQFKVNEEDWGNLFKDEKVYCPWCRHEASSDSWFTTEQVEQARKQVTKHVTGRLDRAFRESAREFNSRQSRNSFIKMSLSVSGFKPYHYILPIVACEEMVSKIECKVCKARYAVIGSAFFCSCCGHNSAEETFDSSIRKIESKLKNIDLIRRTVEEISKDDAELTCRSLIESSLNECVVAFQRFCEVTFIKMSPGTALKFNAFQNLEVGGKYWKDLLGESYTEWLSSMEFERLVTLFQKRHLLSHTEGIVDKKYLDKTHDTTYVEGQRIVIKEKDVKELLALIQIIVKKLRALGSSLFYESLR